MPFAEILGHDRIIEVLRRSVSTGRTSHAYLFEGPEGCGRRKTALALIQALFCQSADGDACGTCPSCRKVAAGNHGDIHLIEPLPEKRDISIAQLRDLQKDLALRPYEAPRKACILEPAERLNVNSANSFLKTLEEPPGNAIIILLTENADMLLPTIRSRCQLIRFSPLSPETIQQLLVNNGREAHEASLMAQMAEGSMQRASLLDNDALAERSEALMKHLAGLSLDRITSVFDAAEELSGNRENTLEVLDLLLSFAKDLLHLKAGCGDIVNSALGPNLEKLAHRIDLQRALQLADDVLETRSSVQRNANPKLSLDHLFMKLAGALSA